MASYYVKGIIKKACAQCAAAAIPGTFYPVADVGLVGASWLYMLSKIADEHNVTFADEPMKFVGTIAAGVGAYWTGGRIFSYAIGLLLAFVTGGMALFAIPVINIILNTYFTWAVGLRMDAIFATYGSSMANMEVAKLIVKSVCHIPSKSEFSEFWREIGGGIF